MPNWTEVLKEIQGTRIDNPLDLTRKKYLAILNEYTGRNVIAYYSGFLQNPQGNVSIDDNDKNALMQAVNGLDKSKGLDLLLHTPGGNIAATESIVLYLKSIFGNDIRAIIPQIAMSAGTMIALSCKEIIMGKQSNIGPIDPQFGGVSCSAVIEEFNKARKEINENPTNIPLWQPIISKYHPTYLGDCEKAIKWSENIVKQWLCENMFSQDADCDSKANVVVSQLGSHEDTFSHARHIHINECKKMGIVVSELENLDPRQKSECKDIQDCVLTIHHAYMHTFSNSPAVKIVENHMGNAMIINRPIQIK